MGPIKADPPTRPQIKSESPKLQRAVDHFLDYQTQARKWIRKHAVQANLRGPNEVLLLFPETPMALRMLIGDCLQNMRSALDHEVYRQALVAKGPTWNGLDEIAFPIVVKSSTFQGRRSLLDEALRPAVVSVIEQMQPYPGRTDFTTQSLEALNAVARIDRHRLIHLSAAQPHGAMHVSRGGGKGPAILNFDVQIQFVDPIEPRLMNVNVHGFLLRLIEVVDDVIQRLQNVEQEAI